LSRSNVVSVSEYTAKEDTVKEFQQWLRTRDADQVLDDAVLGCLLDYQVDELCEDFGISRRDFRVALDAALGEGF